MVAAESSTFCSSTRIARAGNLALRGAGLVGGLLAVIQRLRHREAGAARRVQAVKFASDDLGGRAALGGIRIGVLLADAGGDRDLRTITRKRLRHVFVGGADLGALRVELRIVLIGAHQRGLDGIGQDRCRTRKRHQQDRSRSSGNQLRPRH
jgi:hypothetical protein